MMNRDGRLLDWLRFCRRQVAVVTALVTCLLLVLWVAEAQSVGAAPVNICDRTQEVQDAILGGLTGSPTCSTVADWQLASITELEITGYSSASIVPSDFAGLAILNELTINGSPLLTTVPANAFREVRAKLRELRLNANRISSLHEDAFGGLTALTELSLDNNSILSLDADLFDGLTALTALRLDDNSILSLDEDTFDGLTALTALHFANNRISALDADLFDGLTALTELRLSENRIKVLEDGIFEGTPALRNIVMNNNLISMLGKGAFGGPTNLREIKLDFNSISSLHKDTFDGLTDLRLLYLANNRISSLDADLFDDLARLRDLSLGGNEIESLDADLFDGLTSLETLDLGNNDLTSLPSNLFDGPSNLLFLFLSGNKLESLDADIFDGLTTLWWLYLNINSLASLDPTLFDGLTNLKTLALSDNSLSSLPSGLFDEATALTTLYLHGNSLASLDAGLFDGLTALRTLRLNDNSLASLNAGLFDGLTALRSLYLNGNNLASLNVDIFDGLGDLSTLDLSDNSITALTAGVFEDLDGSMQNLYLWSNGLTALPAEIFTGLTGLKGLDLSCNALTALDLTRFDPFASTLTYLDISNNSFTTPPTQTALRAKLTNSGLILYINQKTECGPPNDTGLSGLSISPGDLTPAFETATPPSFDAVVPHDASTATITITTVDPHAEIGPYTRNDKSLYDDNPNVSGWQVRLPSYRNTFEWEVRGANGVNATKYTLVVFRSRAPSSEAQLRSLELSRVPLGETFDRANEMYMATTAAGETTVTATPLDSDATTVIKLNGTVDADGTVDLELGSNNVITVEVTAEDGTTKKTYTVTVTREAPDAAPAPRLPSGDDPNAIWLATLTVADLGSNYYGYDSAQCNLTDTAFTYLGDNTSISSNSHFKDWGTLYTIDELDYSGGEFHLSLDRKFEHDTADNISVVVGGTELKFADASYAQTTYTYLWTIPNPPWVPGEEVKVKIVVLKDADGPENLTATTTLVATRVLVPTTTTYEDVYTTYDMTLTWSTPTTGGPVAGYRVEYQPSPALQWQRLQGSRQTGTTYTLSGLKRSVVGYYRVVAMRPGTGPSYSDVVRVQAEPETEEIPEEVGYLVSKRPVSDTALKLAWNRVYTLDSRDVTMDLEDLGRNDVPYPLSNRARATSYEVQYVEDNGEYGEYGYPLRRAGEDWVTVTVRNWANGLDWQNWLGAIEEIESKESSEESPHLQTVVKGLEPGTRYYVRVRGCTDAGCSGWMIPYLKTTSGMKTMNATEADPLTATLQDIPANHDGLTAFTFRIAFSAEVTISPQDMRDHALTVSGGTVTDARRVDSRKDLWELTVAPTGTGAVSILALQNRACTETGALCTADGRMLSTGLGRSVPGPAPQGRQSRAPLANSPATGAPSISGTVQVGETLTADTSGIADTDGLTGVSYSYQWIRNDGTSDTDIQNATGSSYPLAADDEGKTIKVEVRFTDDADNEETLTSTATAEVAAATPTDPPRRPLNLTAAANEDGTVTLSWDAPDDDSITGYQILRRRPTKGEPTLLVHVNDTGSSATEYTDSDVTPDVGHTYRVKAINPAGLSRWSNFVTVTPTQNAEPVQNTPATGILTISGTAQVGETLTADTSGIADTDGLTNVSYSYQWTVSDGGADIDIARATDSTYTLVANDEGLVIKVKVSFTDDAGNEESLTSTATSSVAAPD